MNYDFYDMRFFNPDLRRANKSELVHLDIVDYILDDYIIVKQNENSQLPEEIYLSPTYRERFKLEFH